MARKDAPPHVVTAPGSREVKFRAVDPSGRVIPGAKAEFQAIPYQPAEPRKGPLAALLREQHYYIVRIGADGYITVQRAILVAEGTKTVEFVLRPAATIRGRTTSSFVIMVGGSWERHPVGKDGSFSIVVPAGVVTLTALDPGHRPSAHTSLEIRHGETLFLRGASGAGKTTLLYTLAGLERPDSGTVEIDGQSLYGMPKAMQSDFRNRRIGYVFQHYFLLPDLTALENVLLPASMAGKAGSETGRAKQLLEQVGLGRRLGHRPTELSGGEQQRVAIARSLINDPEILFADEPTGNLDSTTGGEVIDALLAVVRSERKTLIVVTHDSRLAALGDRQLEIIDGRIEP